MGIVPALIGLILVASLGAPRELVAPAVAMEVGLVTSLAITLFWKMSIHVASVAGAIVILTLVVGPPHVLLTPLVALVGWVGVELSDHTTSQVTVEALIGAAVAASVFQALQ